MFSDDFASMLSYKISFRNYRHPLCVETSAGSCIVDLFSDQVRSPGRNRERRNNARHEAYREYYSSISN